MTNTHAFTPGPWSVGEIDDWGSGSNLPPEIGLSVNGSRWSKIVESVSVSPGDARLIALSTVIPALYASEINARIEWFWDGGYDVAIGDEMNGWRARASVDGWCEALEWLRDAAVKHWPESEFALAIAKATSTQGSTR